MTPRPPMPADSPEVLVVPQIACSAGRTVVVDVQVQHRGRTPAMLTVTVLGLDNGWVPQPVQLGPLQPGESVGLGLTINPERGALSARYPFVIAAEIAPTGRSADGSVVMPSAGAKPVLGIAESTLVVDGRERVALAIDPSTVEAVSARKILLHITNPGTRDRRLTLTGESAPGIHVQLRDDEVIAPAGRTVSVPGKVRVARPRLLAGGAVHSFVLTARGDGAPERVDGTVNARPLIRGAVMKIGALALVLAVWAAAALLLIPKLSNQFTAHNTVPGASQSAQATGTGVAGGGSGAPGTKAGGSGSGGTGGSGSAGAGGTTPGGAPGSTGAGGTAPGSGAPGAGGTPGANQPGTTLSGTISGASPGGVHIGLQPTSLVQATDVQAAPAPGDTATADLLRSGSGAFGKIPAEAVRLAPAGQGGAQSTETDAQGAFALGGITGPGYYLLTMAKAGFQTQRFIINSATLAAGLPLDVTMVAGSGRLTGQVNGPKGPVGAASITITDGTVSLATSTVSPSTTGNSGNAKPGSWSADGLTTPGTYLVTATSPGLGTAASLVTLAAGGSGTVALNMKAGVAAVSGTVSGLDGLGRLGGLGGIGISITDGKITRTATTVTTGPVGTYVLPDLPAPGDYTMTITGDGYSSQVRSISIPAGSGGLTVDVSLSAAAGVVTGTTFDEGGAGLEGVGLTLSGDSVSYKTMSTSSPAGQFRFSGVAPGSYLLSATTFGRASTSTTVTVTAAGTAQADLRLPADAAIELAATAHIQGRVVDASTGSALTCDRSPVPGVECRVTVSVPVPVNPAADNGQRIIISSTAGPAEDYSLPARNDPKHRGLVAGLYTMTISAPGYESTTTQVQVAQGQITVAPQISLQPLGLIAGSITAHVGKPATPSCVVAAPAGATVPTSCAPSGKSCTVPGGGPARCAQVAADGSYQIIGLLHGNYQVGVLTTDREYLSVAASTVQVPLGGDARYDAILDRLGRATVTVLKPNLTTVALTPAPGAAVSFTPIGNAPPGFPIGRPKTTAADGTLSVAGLNGTYTVTARDGGLARVALPVGLNQSQAVTLVLTNPIGAVVGRVTTSVDGVTVSVSGAKVTVSGVVGFTEQTPVSGSATVTTAANGCFAILPANWPATGGPPLANADCPSVPRSATSVMSDTSGKPASLVVLPVTVSVAAADTRTQEYKATATLVGGTGPVKSLPVVIVDATPSPVGPQAIRQELPEGDPLVSMLDAQVTVTKRPAGAGAVTVRSDSAGNLLFTDASLATPGIAVPGRYSLHVEQAGFVSGNADLLCALGKACVMVATDTSNAGPLRLRELAKITGTLTVPTPLPSGVNENDLLASFVRTTATGVGAITVSVGVATAKRGAGDTIIGYTYAFNFRDDAQPRAGLAAAGDYTFQFNLNGYAGSTVTIKCGADFVAGCDPVNSTLKPYPRLLSTAKVTTDPAGLPAEMAGATKINVIAPDGGAVTVTVDPATAALGWQQDTLPPNVIKPGTYRVSAILTGFDQSPDTTTFTCNDDQVTCNPGIKMVQRTDLQFNFVNAGGTAVPDVDLALTGNTLSAPAKASTGPTGSTATITNMVALPSASYSLHVQAAGYQYADYTGTSGAVQCDAAPRSGLIPHPGGITVCTVTLTAIGSIALASWESITKPAPDNTVINNTLGNVAVTLRAANADGTPKAGAPTFSGVTDSAGHLVLTGTKTDQGLLAGEYLVTATGFGHAKATGTVQLNGTPGGTYSLSLATGALTVAGDGSLQVTLPINPVDVQLVLSAVDDQTHTPLMQPMIAYLYGANGNYTCDYAPGTPPSCAVDGDQAHVDFPAVNPGSYLVIVTPPSSGVQLFNPVGLWLDVPLGMTSPLSQPVYLTLKTNNQRVTVLGPDGKQFTGAATVSLMQMDQNGVLQIALDAGGQQLTADWPPTGDATEISFAGIPDGLYYLRVTASGYDDYTSAAITLNRSIIPAPPLVTAKLTRAERTVSLAVESTAKGPDGAANLAGTILTLTQTTSDTGTPTGSVPGVLVSGPAPGPFTAAINQALATGTWKSTSTQQSGVTGSGTGGALSALFQATGSEFNVDSTGGANQSRTTLLHQGLAHLTVSWNKTDCTDKTPITGNLPLTISTGTPKQSISVQAAVSSDGTSATADVYLPPGTYSWTADLTALGSNWTSGGGFANFTIAVPADATTGSVAAVTGTGTLAYSAAAVTATLSQDGSPGTGNVTATQTANPAVKQTFPLGTTACLAAVGWSFQLADTNAHLPAQTKTLDVTKTTTVAFTGFSLIPRVALTDVTDRVLDAKARVITTTVKAGTTTIFTQPLTIPAGQLVAIGTTQIVPADAYTLTASNGLTGDVFAASATGSITLAAGSGNHTVTATFAYEASTLRLNTSLAGSGNVIAGVTVELIPADPNRATWPTSSSNGVVVLSDVTPGTYTILVRGQSGGAQYQQILPDHVFTAGVTAAIPVTLAQTTTATVALNVTAPSGVDSGQLQLIPADPQTPTQSIALNTTVLLTGITPGDYDLVISGTKSGDLYLAQLPGTSLGVGSLTELTATLAETGNSVIVRPDANGQPLAGGTAQLLRDDGTVVAPKTFNANGIATFTGVTQGTYHLAVTGTIDGASTVYSVLVPNQTVAKGLTVLTPTAVTHSAASAATVLLHPTLSGHSAFAGITVTEGATAITTTTLAGPYLQLSATAASHTYTVTWVSGTNTYTDDVTVPAKAGINAPVDAPLVLKPPPAGP